MPQKLKIWGNCEFIIKLSKAIAFKKTCIRMLSTSLYVVLYIYNLKNVNKTIEVHNFLEV